MTRNSISIREEQSSDRSAIRSVHLAAFEGAIEADLVDRLRESCHERISLVAVLDRLLVGHILFTPATIESPDRRLGGWALAPMAVLPEYQRRRIGTLLVEHGLAMVRAKQAPYVVVLGHPQYYPRFGFDQASQWSVRCEWDVPSEVFMILPLDRDQLHGAKGLARYRPEFSDAV
jgi:putative acetyltransferase